MSPVAHSRVVCEVQETDTDPDDEEGEQGALHSEQTTVPLVLADEDEPDRPKSTVFLKMRDN